MIHEVNIHDLREWVKRADDDTLQEFLDEIRPVIDLLEEEDFFGTEGFNKRFA